MDGPNVAALRIEYGFFTLEDERFDQSDFVSHNNGCCIIDESRQTCYRVSKITQSLSYSQPDGAKEFEFVGEQDRLHEGQSSIVGMLKTVLSLLKLLSLLLLVVIWGNFKCPMDHWIKINY